MERIGRLCISTALVGMGHSEGSWNVLAVRDIDSPSNCVCWKEQKFVRKQPSNRPPRAKINDTWLSRV